MRRRGRCNLQWHLEGVWSLLVIECTPYFIWSDLLEVTKAEAEIVPPVSVKPAEEAEERS